MSMQPPTPPSAAPLFDRRIPDALMLVLLPGGPFSWVTELARQPISPNSPPLDLGLRASPKKPGAGHAMLYVGTTQVLAIDLERKGRFRVRPHKRGELFKDVAVPFRDAWDEWQDIDRLAEAMPGIIAHVEAAIAAAPRGRQGEGLYQAALAKPTSAGFTLVDREVMFTFTTTPEKLKRKAELREPLVRAQAAIAASHPFGCGTRPPGDKLDGLAIDRDGRPLAIEVKPGAKTDPLVCTPIQVAMYQRLLRAWIEADEVYARLVLQGMAAQRAALGLGSTEVPPLCDPREIAPVIAVGKPVKEREEAHRKVELVRDALREVEEPLTGLRFWAIEKTGEISITDALELDERFE